MTPAADAGSVAVATASEPQRFSCGRLPMCPNEMVPLQIDLAIGVRRYLLLRSANPGVRGQVIPTRTDRIRIRLIGQAHVSGCDVAGRVRAPVE